jgi:signal transduction histidine kinase
MYGWIHQCAEDLVCGAFGESSWDQVLEKAGCAHVGRGGWTRHEYYEDAVCYRIVGGCSEVLGISTTQVLEAFGKHFVQFAIKSGYNKVLASLGSTLEDFLCGLDRMHRHLTHNLPELIAPAFWTMEDDSDPSVLVLCYSSKRKGLEAMVPGILKEVATVYFSMEIDVWIKSPQAQQEGGEYLTVFGIMSVAPSPPLRSPTSESQAEEIWEQVTATDSGSTTTSTSGGSPTGGRRGGGVMRRVTEKLHPRMNELKLQRCPFSGLDFTLPPPPPKLVAPQEQAGRPCKYEKEDEEESATRVCLTGVLHSLPYHVIFGSEELNIIAAGTQLCALLPNVCSPGATLHGIFKMLLLSHVASEALQEITPNAVSKACERSHDGDANVVLVSRELLPGASQPIYLKGQVKRLAVGQYFFHGVPRVMTMDEMIQSGLSVNHLPGYSTSLDLLMTGEQVFRQNRERNAQLMEAEAQASRMTNVRLVHALQFLSHEVRNQLAPMDALARESTGVHGETMITCLQTASDILNNVLAIARLNAGKTDAPMGKFKLGEIFSAVEAYGSHVAKTHGVAFSASIRAESLGSDPRMLTVYSSRTWLIQIFTNMLSNASKFTPQAGTISVVWNVDVARDSSSSSSSEEEAGVLLRFTCRDTGCGIKEENLKLVLEDFGMVRSCASDGTASGTGLGLPLAKRMAEALGGMLSISSVWGEGTVVDIKAPLQLVLEEEGHATLSEDPFSALLLATRAMEGASLTADVLGVDDNNLILKMYRHTVERSELTFESSMDGTDALERIRRGEKFGIIFIDMQMPSMNGNVACLEIRKLGYQGPVVLVTGDFVDSTWRDRLVDHYGLSVIVVKGGAISWQQVLRRWIELRSHY